MNQIVMIIYPFFSAKNHLEHSIFKEFSGPSPGALPLDPCRRSLAAHRKDRRRLASLAGCKVRDFLPEQPRDFTFL